MRKDYIIMFRKLRYSFGGLRRVFSFSKSKEEISIHVCLSTFSAYHGHLITTIDISPYKFNKPNGTGKQDWVHVVSI